MVIKRKRLILTAMALIVVALAGQTVAQAKITKAQRALIKEREHHGIVTMPSARSLSLTGIIIWQRAIIKHDIWVLRTAKSHKPLIVKFHRLQLKWTRQALKKTLVLKAKTSWPTHHSLWMCIHSHEAADWHNNDTGHNGHYGGLQMHPGWGYGTSYYASSDSQYVQERAAENGYIASGFSKSWLMHQWYHPDCLRYA